MPLTSAEKMKRRREKLKRLGQYDDFKAKHRLQAKKSRTKTKLTIENLPPIQKKNKLEEIRRKTRERVQKYRKKNKENIGDVFPSNTTYSSCALGKAKSRVKKALPACPLKKKIVLQKLLEQIDIEQPSTSNRKSKHSIPEEVVEKVLNFFERDDISRQAPGLKDVKTIRDGTTKTKKQIRHLFTTISEAYALFVEEYGKTLGKSKFAELRPPHVLLSSAIPRYVCLCRYHENYILAVNSLHTIAKTFNSYDNSFLYKILCKTPTRDCWESKCKRCKTKLERKIDTAVQAAEDLPFEITWHFWTDDNKGKLCKTVQSGDINTLKAHILRMTPSFKLHSLTKKSQARCYEKDRNAAVSNINAEACLLQVDFSENYICLAQDEIQSFHWVQPQITLFTMSLWHSGQHFPIVIVSDNRHHNKDTIVPYIARALKEVPDNVKEVHLWSDGPASQFKNKYIAASIPLLENMTKKRLVWNYFATSRGKGPVDGIGGALKRLIRSKVVSRVEKVFNAKEFAHVGNKYSNIKVIELKEEDIERSSEDMQLNHVFENAAAIPGISKIHNFYTINGIVERKELTPNSNLIKSRYEQIYGSGDSSDDDLPLSDLRK